MMEHDVIYLQTDEAAESLGLEGVTWCQDKINDGDIKYLLATPEREAAPDLLEYGRMLALDLPDGELDLAREVWGNTNVAVVTHWRDKLLAIIALAAPPAGADATLEKE